MQLTLAAEAAAAAEKTPSSEAQQKQQRHFQRGVDGESPRTHPREVATLAATDTATA
jgi:hypothetical protein